MAKKKDKAQGPRVVPAHWRAPDVSTAPAVFSDNPADWPLGPVWASRLDYMGTQGVFLSRLRPIGHLSVVVVLLSERDGLKDRLVEDAVSPARLERTVQMFSGPDGRGYPVTAEYAGWRIRQGEEAAAAAGKTVPPAKVRATALLEGVPTDWTPDFDAMEAEGHRPPMIGQTGLLVHAYEFHDWWLTIEDSPLIAEFLTDLVTSLNALEDKGAVGNLGKPEPPANMDELLAETKHLVLPDPFSEAGRALLDEKIEDHGMRIFELPLAERYRHRLQHMAYLTGQAGQDTYSKLIWTAAWGLRPERGYPAAHHPFLKGLLRLTAVRHVLGLDDRHSDDDGHDHSGHDHSGHDHGRQQFQGRRGRR